MPNALANFLSRPAFPTSPEQSCCHKGHLQGCLAALIGCLLWTALPAAASTQATTTTLTVTSGGTAVTTVSSGSVVTLTAAVTAGSTPVTVGLINFCDATATYCTDIHLLATAQLTKTGTATFKFRPGIGDRSYKAVFLGTPNGAMPYAGSASGTSALTVTGTATGKSPTTTTIAQSGGPGNYTLTAIVAGPVNRSWLPPPSGTVSFLDTSNANSVLSTTLLGAGTAVPGWAHSQTPEVGDSPGGIAAGDFNGDGIPDLAVLNGDGTVTILLGNGDATFTRMAKSPAAGGDTAIAVGDFNGDGILDLAVPNDGDNTVTILLGNGDGTFTATETSPETGSYPDAIAVGDFNGDGIPDLAVANEDNTVTILLGNGDGTFTSAPSLAGGAWPVGFAVGDFTGNGIQDLAVTDAYGNNVTIQLGNGDGTFTVVAESPATGDFPQGVVAGDFNGDGILDLAVANNQGDVPVTILLGNGDGTFKAVPGIPAIGGNPKAIVLGDFNSDGIPDLAVANLAGSTSLEGASMTVLLGNGDGTFTAAADEPGTEDFPNSMAAGDFNGDGLMDLAAANYCGADDVCEGNGPATGTVTVLETENKQTATATVSAISPAGTGTHLVEASYPGDSNYASSVSGAVALNAGPHTPTITWATPAPIFNETALGGILDATAQNGSEPVAGSFAYSATPAGGTAVAVTAATMLTGGGYTLTATFTPTDTTEYSTATATVQLTVYQPAALTSPTPGTVLTGSSVAFTWSAGSGATDYELLLGTTGVGSANLHYSGTTTAITETVSGLPTLGVTVYARLSSEIGGVWYPADYTYTEAGTLVPATLSPAPGTVLSASTTFSWSGAAGPSEYDLLLGTAGAGSRNLYGSAVTTATSETVTLPTNGVMVFARFSQRINGIWQYADYTYTEGGTLVPATLSPAPGTVLSATTTFSWSGAAGPSEYDLLLGTAGAGSRNLYGSAVTTATSETVTLPTNGVMVFARFSQRINGIWQYADYTYTEGGTLVPATLSPAPGTVLSATTTFSWSGAAGPSEYDLLLGTAGAGSRNLYASAVTTAASETVTLPTNGVMVFARFSQRINGIWQYADYTYTEGP